MRKCFYTFLACCSAAGLFLGGCSSFHTKDPASAANELKILTIGTADSGGTMYPVGKAIAQIISDADTQLNVNLSASNGSSFNVESLENGEIDLGLVSGDIAFAAVNGLDEFSENPAENIRVIAAVYPSLSNWMVRSDLEISHVHELKGKRIGVGPLNSTTELSARISLKAMNISSENADFTICGIGSGADEVKEGTLDAIHGFAGVPIPGLAELAESVPCTLLEYTDKELSLILRENAFYYPDIIPAGTYKGQDADIKTFGIKCLLCVNTSMDEDLVYELTKILYEHTGELEKMHGSLASMSKDGFMYDDLPIVLHEGAERYYKEAGMLLPRK